MTSVSLTNPDHGAAAVAALRRRESSGKLLQQSTTDSSKTNCLANMMASSLVSPHVLEQMELRQGLKKASSPSSGKTMGERQDSFNSNHHQNNNKQAALQLQQVKRAQSCKHLQFSDLVSPETLRDMNARQMRFKAKHVRNGVVSDHAYEKQEVEELKSEFEDDNNKKLHQNIVNGSQPLLLSELVSPETLRQMNARQISFQAKAIVIAELEDFDNDIDSEVDDDSDSDSVLSECGSDSDWPDNDSVDDLSSEDHSDSHEDEDEDLQYCNSSSSSYTQDDLEHLDKGKGTEKKRNYHRPKVTSLDEQDEPPKPRKKPVHEKACPSDQVVGTPSPQDKTKVPARRKPYPRSATHNVHNEHDKDDNDNDNGDKATTRNTPPSSNRSRSSKQQHTATTTSTRHNTRRSRIRERMTRSLSQRHCRQPGGAANTNRSSIRSRGGNVLQTQLAQAVSRRNDLEDEDANNDDDEKASSDSSNSSEDETPEKQRRNKDKKIKTKKNKKTKKGVVKKAKRAFKRSSKRNSKGHGALQDSFIVEETTLDDTSIPEYLNIVMEIVSGRNLLIGDTTTSDPYVLVKLGSTKIHKTAKIMKTLNPDWSPETRSTFLLACDARELLDFGLTFKVKDWDMIGGDDPLGTVFLNGLEVIEHCNKGQLQTFIITPPKGQQGVDAGTLTIRWRKATRADYESLRNKENKNLFE